MAATAVDAPTGAGTGSRRAVVRSEKFMEWQREIHISRSVSAVRKLGHSSALLTTERHSSDEENVKMAMGGREGSEEREGEGEAAVVADSQGGADGGGEADQQRGNNNKGKKTQQQQHQRQRSDAKKVRKEEGDQNQNQNQKKSNLSSGKDPAAAVAAGEGEGGRLRRCKQQGNPASGVKRAAGHATTQQQQQQVAQPLARKRQRRMPRPFSPLKEDVERGLRSLTRNRGSEGVVAATRAAATNCSKGATKRSKRVAQRLANEEPAPPPLKLPKLHIILTRKEIQEDWLKITGHKYTGKPRKSLLVGRDMVQGDSPSLEKSEVTMIDE